MENTEMQNEALEVLKQKLDSAYEQMLEIHRNEYKRFKDAVHNFKFHLNENDPDYPQKLKNIVEEMEDSATKANQVLDNILQFMKKYGYPEEQIEAYEGRRIQIVEEDNKKEETQINLPETVKFWIAEFNNNDISVEDEIEQVKGAISNEAIWAHGSDGESINQHLQNITELNLYLSWLEEQLENK